MKARGMHFWTHSSMLSCNSSLSLCRWSTQIPCRYTPSKKHQYLLYSWLIGRRYLYGRVETSPPTGFKPQTVHSLPNRSTLHSSPPIKAVVPVAINPAHICVQHNTVYFVSQISFVTCSRGFVLWLDCWLLLSQKHSMTVYLYVIIKFNW